MPSNSSPRNIACYVFIAHSLLAVLVLLLVERYWTRFGSGASELWVLFLLIDFPSAWFYFALDKWTLPFDLGLQFRFAVLPFLTVLLFGGWQWYMVTLVIFMYKQDRQARMGVCEQCGYDLAGNESGVCPECGTRFARPLKQDRT